VVAELQKQVADGSRVVVVSGTYQIVAQRFAARFGAEGIGTPLEMDANGLATGKLIGKLNTGEQKVFSIRQKLGATSVFAAYGDTEGDIPMLSIAQNPVAVYPNKLLAEVARAKGWRVMG
jgi:phosphoserine phosphatase